MILDGLWDDEAIEEKAVLLTRALTETNYREAETRRKIHGGKAVYQKYRKKSRRLRLSRKLAVASWSWVCFSKVALRVWG